MRTLRILGAMVLAGLTSCGGCEPDPEPDISGSTGEDEVRELVLLHPPAEGPSQELFGPARPTLRDVVRQIEHAAQTDSAKGLFLRVGPLGGRWGRVADLVEALEQVKDADKPIHCHFDSADNTSYALMARACDRISMTPGGTLNLVGVAAQVFFVRTLLERIGAQADLLHMGRYKGAGDMFTRDDISPEAEESLGALLDDFDRVLVASIESRARDPRAVIDGGPYHAEAAREAGLVDDVGFDDEAREHARQAGGVEKVRRVPLGARVEEVQLSDVIQALAGEDDDEEPAGARIVLVHLEGSITDGDRPRPGEARSGPFVAAMRGYADDEDVKAVVLRIDSPGGSALASDRMWHAVRRVASRKPVIASLGDVAASGGYYVASAATEVLAHEASIVGSIGVIGGKVSFGGLAEELGVSSVVLERGRHAAWTSVTRPFEESEREVIEGMLRSTYYRFIRRVATGRDMPRADVLRAAEGRVMSGRLGKELGLIDDIGGLGEALRRARERADLGDDAEIEVWPAARGFMDSLSAAMGGDAQTPDQRWADLMRQLGPVGEASVLAPMMLRDEPVALGLPFVLVVE